MKLEKQENLQKYGKHFAISIILTMLEHSKLNQKDNMIPYTILTTENQLSTTTTEYM